MISVSALFFAVSNIVLKIGNNALEPLNHSVRSRYLRLHICNVAIGGIAKTFERNGGHAETIAIGYDCVRLAIAAKLNLEAIVLHAIADCFVYFVPHPLIGSNDVNYCFLKCLYRVFR